jgi:hypothetical protein
MKINFLWIGDKLQEVCQIGLKSFINQGHECVLWTFGKVEGVPKQVQIADGHEFVPLDVYSKWFGPNARQPDHKHKSRVVQAFSDYFRYELLYKYGGWWCDTDIICLKPFEFDEPYVFAWADWPCKWMTPELAQIHGRDKSVQSGVLKMPAGNEFLKEVLSDIRPKAQEADHPFWAEWIRCLTQLTPKHNLAKYIQDKPIFDPLGGPRWEELYDNPELEIPDWAYSVHAYTSNRKFDIPPGSFLDKQRPKIMI